MGKSWQHERGKLTPSSSCFMKAWQTCSERRKEVAEEGERDEDRKRKDGGGPRYLLTSVGSQGLPLWRQTSHRGLVLFKDPKV